MLKYPGNLAAEIPCRYKKAQNDGRETPNLNIFPDLILHKIQRISPSLIIWHALVAVPSLFNRRPPSMGPCKPLLWSFWPLSVPLVKLMPHRPGFLFLDLVGRVHRCHKYNLHRQKAHKTIIPQVGIYILYFIVSNTYVIKICLLGGWHLTSAVVAGLWNFPEGTRFAFHTSFIKRVSPINS